MVGFSEVAINAYVSATFCVRICLVKMENVQCVYYVHFVSQKGPDSCITVHTAPTQQGSPQANALAGATASWRAKRVIVAPGAWLTKMASLTGLHLPTRVSDEVLPSPY